MAIIDTARQAERDTKAKLAASAERALLGARVEAACSAVWAVRSAVGPETTISAAWVGRYGTAPCAYLALDDELVLWLYEMPTGRYRWGVVCRDGDSMTPALRHPEAGADPRGIGPGLNLATLGELLSLIEQQPGWAVAAPDWFGAALAQDSRTEPVEAAVAQADLLGTHHRWRMTVEKLAGCDPRTAGAETGTPAGPAPAPVPPYLWPDPTGDGWVDAWNDWHPTLEDALEATSASVTRPTCLSHGEAVVDPAEKARRQARPARHPGADR